VTAYEIKIHEIEISPQHIPNTMNQENRPFLSIKEVSELLGISVSTINRLIKRGEFPPKIKISPRRIVFMKNDINEWIKKIEKNKVN